MIELRPYRRIKHLEADLELLLKHVERIERREGELREQVILLKHWVGGNSFGGWPFPPLAVE